MSMMSMSTLEDHLYRVSSEFSTEYRWFPIWAVYVVLGRWYEAIFSCYGFSRLYEIAVGSDPQRRYMLSYITFSRTRYLVGFSYMLARAKNYDCDFQIFKISSNLPSFALICSHLLSFALICPHLPSFVLTCSYFLLFLLC
jgi:hypothetical protein